MGRVKGMNVRYEEIERMKVMKYGERERIKVRDWESKWM